MEPLPSNWRLTMPAVIITPVPRTGPHLQEPTNIINNNHCLPQVPTVSTNVNKPTWLECQQNHGYFRFHLDSAAAQKTGFYTYYSPAALQKRQRMIESVSDKKDFDILVRDVVLKIKMTAVLSKPRLVPKFQSTFYLAPTLHSSIFFKQNFCVY